MIQTTTSSSSPTETTPDLVQMGFSDETFAGLLEMGYSMEMIARAIKENGEACSSWLCSYLNTHVYLVYQ